ncbi:MAG: MerR family transcriptional regulator [Shimia sp.]|uniref:MerR family transcriptional regulator n=1 Tax=Shimia sp. TaxID=1954381 RepID=UPI001B02DB70|nr:MerR family transcriptional regulator [Shimia sp.]MBO6899097.1 MerR family transcriptional regulator [Shimia sp.]
MLIGELSHEAGVSRDALRLYEKRGLIRSSRGANGYRVFPEETVEVVAVIREAQALGFKLKEIEELMPGISNAGASAETLAETLRAKADEIDRRIQGLTSLRERLSRRIETACPIHRAIRGNTDSSRTEGT